MPPNYKKLQEKITFDAIMPVLHEQWARLRDHRRANASYPLTDFLCSAFAMFSLKAPSLLSFEQQTKTENRNLKSIYRMQEVPSDTQMRTTLDLVNPAPLRQCFRTLSDLVREAGVIREYHFWNDAVLVTADGVEHFSSRQIHCPHCSRRTLRDGSTEYFHSGLGAVLVNPAYEEVLPLDFEPIIRQDGDSKNDCERNAAKRLCASLRERYPDLKIILVEDALYANAPHIRQIQSYDWSFILNVKPDSHVSLEKQFAGRRATGQVREWQYRDETGFRHSFAWTSGLCLNESAIDVTVNYLLYEQTDRNGVVTRWTWITNLPLTKRTVERVMRGGRGRWKIENETFNTLKNQGYHFAHNYGHGEKNLGTVLALLMFLAFTVDQMLQRCWKTFRKVRAGLRTKAKLWESVRAFFKVRLFRSMEKLYRAIAAAYDIQLR